MKLKHILPLLLILPFLSGCNDSDDVLSIFTQGKWKLTSIFYDKGSKKQVCEDYWGNEASKEASMDLLDQKANFTITFNGAELDDGVQGSYTGRAAGSNISGEWFAEGKHNAFNVYNQSAPDNKEDVLGKAFINALRNAYKYDGDTNGNLRIYFEDKDRKDKRFLLLHIIE